MAGAPIVLVPGWWLGAWAWDEVAADLRAGGHQVTALTLPGLESVDADRSRITFDDHVRAICDAVAAAGRPVVLCVHSGAGAPGYAASDRCPEDIAAMIYVDTGPAKGALDDEFEGVEKPLPDQEELAASENLSGISETKMAEFRRRAVPEPAGAMTGAANLTNDARLDIPTTAICTAFPSAEYQQYAKQGMPFLAGYNELHHITWVDLPTSHWPMFSRPHELAGIIDRVATDAST
jgi:pimeloyl-ACP methyl ester carboxylesterase